MKRHQFSQINSTLERQMNTEVLRLRGSLLFIETPFPRNTKLHRSDL